jgi:hypothetical protein
MVGTIIPEAKNKAVAAKTKKYHGLSPTKS